MQLFFVHGGIWFLGGMIMISCACCCLLFSRIKIKTQTVRKIIGYYYLQKSLTYLYLLAAYISS